MILANSIGIAADDPEKDLTELERIDRVGQVRQSRFRAARDLDEFRKRFLHEINSCLRARGGGVLT